MKEFSKEEYKVKITEALRELRKYSKPSTKKAVIQIINSFGPFIALWITMYLLWDVSKWAVVGLALLNSFFLVRIFIIQHDCGHQNYVKSKFWRDVIGYSCSLASSIPYFYWAKSHHFHHTNSGALEVRDIGDLNTLTVNEYASLPRAKRVAYRVYRSFPVMFLIIPIYYILIHNRLPMVKLPEFKKIRPQLYLANLVFILLMVGLCLVLDWRKVLFVQGFTLGFFSIIAIWFFYIQHQHEHSYKHWKDKWEFMIAAVKGSSYYKLPSIFNWFTGNIAIHHVHHLNPAIPNYNLAKSIESIPWFNDLTTKITFMESLKLAANKLWDEQSERMITFKEYYQLKKQRAK